MGEKGKSVPAEARIQLEQAYAHDAAGEFEQALRECEAVIELAPSLAEAHNLRGILLEELGYKQEAIKAYRRAVQLAPDFHDAELNLSDLQTELIEPHLERAYDLLVAGKAERALRECEAALEIVPSHAPAHNLRGFALEELGHGAEAAEAYRQAIRLDPGLEDAAVNLSELESEWPEEHLSDESAREAPVPGTGPEEDVPCRRERPKRRWRTAWYGLGMLVIMACFIVRFFSSPRSYLHDPYATQQALALLTWALGMRPQNAATHVSQALGHQRRGEIELAVADLTRAIALDPRNVDAYNRRGDLYMIRGELDKAVADYDQVIALDPENAHAYRNRGTTYYDMGLPEPAIADLSQAIALDPQEIEPYLFRALSYGMQGQFESAVADCTEAIGMDPRNTEAYVVRGIAYAGQGNLERAIADYTQAITLDSGEASAHYLRGLVYAEISEVEKAVSDWKRVLTLSSDPQLRQRAAEQLEALGE